MVCKRAGIKSIKSQQQDILDARKEAEDTIPPHEAVSTIDDKMFWFVMLDNKIKGTVYNIAT